MNRPTKLTAIVALMCVMMLGFAPQGKSQAMLGFGFNSASIPDTVRVGDTLHVSFYVKNYNTSIPFSGSFMLNGGLLDSLGLDSIIGVQNLNYFIGPGDSIPYNFDVPVIPWNSFSGSGFRVGGNVVVVWPSILANNNFTVIDTIVDSLVVLESVHDRPADGNPPARSLNIYPNPASSMIQLNMLTPGNTIERVRLFDLSGRVLLDEGGNNMHLDISELNPGMYFLEATLSGSKYPEIYKIQRK